VSVCVFNIFWHRPRLLKENEKSLVDNYAQYLHNLIVIFSINISTLQYFYQSRCSDEELSTILSPQEVIVLLRCCCTKLPQLCPTSRLLSKAPKRGTHKVLTYIEYRAVFGVFQTIDPPPLSTQRVCPPPAPKAGGCTVHTRRAVRGWEVNILEDARHWIGLLQYNPSTGVLILYR
jgi:hypothetical protein